MSNEPFSEEQLKKIEEIFEKKFKEMVKKLRDGMGLPIRVEENK